MGDEYTRRFDDPGLNFSRDAAEILALRRGKSGWGFYGGARYAYNVHPEESKRWVIRTGLEWESADGGEGFLPFVAADVEWDQDAKARPRLEARGGAWLPPIGGRRSLNLALTFLTGPSPLGQFNGGGTTQFGLSLQGNL
jgi:hypothetical protein